MARPRTTKTFQGNPCSRCGGTERYLKSTGTCVQCSRTRARKHRPRNTARPEEEIRRDFAAQLTAMVHKWDAMLADDNAAR